MRANSVPEEDDYLESQRPQPAAWLVEAPRFSGGPPNGPRAKAVAGIERGRKASAQERRRSRLGPDPVDPGIALQKFCTKLRHQPHAPGLIAHQRSYGPPMHM